MSLKFKKIVLILFFYSFSFGHSGRTDNYGGHYNHKTGKYHYHNGKGSSSGIFKVVIAICVIGFLLVITDDNRKK